MRIYYEDFVLYTILKDFKPTIRLEKNFRFVYPVNILIRCLFECPFFINERQFSFATVTDQKVCLTLYNRQYYTTITRLSTEYVMVKYSVYFKT